MATLEYNNRTYENILSDLLSAMGGPSDTPWTFENISDTFLVGTFLPQTGFTRVAVPRARGN